MADAPPVTELDRRTRIQEVWLVLGVSLGASAAYAILDIVRRQTAGKPLAQQQVGLNIAVTPDRPWLDLAYQLLAIAVALVPALLAVHLMARDRSLPALGLRPVRPGFDLATGAGLAALIGLPGLGLYLAARALGLAVEVVPAGLGHVWWATPVLVLSAIQNAALEEVVVVGYLVTRLRQIGWALPAVVLTSALLRGSYHLYQGYGGFAGNAVMGVIFALFFLRFRRVGPLIVAHACIDTVAFVGYALLGSHLSFLH
jgi:membrane protease YdiL (CAAX protease family)